MRSNSRSFLLAALSIGAMAAPASEAHATDWTYCPGDCPAPEVTAEVVQGRDGSCAVEVSMRTPAAMVFQADGGYHQIAFTEYDALTDIYDVGGFESWQIQFDYDSDALLVPTNVYDVIDPDDDGYSAADADFGSVVVQTTELSAEPGDSGTVYSLGFLWEDVLNFPSAPLPVGEVLASADWFCPLPAWSGDHALSVEVTPNGSDGTCTVDVSLTSYAVNDSNADLDEFDIMVVEDGAMSFLEPNGEYLDIVGGLYAFEESFVVEDGASGSIEALFTDMDTTTPVTELLDTEAWSCVACEQLDTDLNGDGVVNVPDLLAFIQAYGGTDPAADFDNNGVVGVSDLTILMADFGQPSC